MQRDTIQKLASNASQAAALMKALSNEHRLLILCHLIAEEEMSVGALVDRIGGLSQSALSQHLAKLRAEGIVDFRRESQTLFYRVADARAAGVLTLLCDLFCGNRKDEELGRDGYDARGTEPRWGIAK